MNRETRYRELVTGTVELGVLAALAYIPLLLTKPGMVAADTKQYLYLDPGTLMAQALSMWDPSTAAGTVTHQQIGYLLPQGPFYWSLAHLAVPTWVAQRLWMGSLLFLAGAGVRYAMRAVGLVASGPLVTGVVYELSPYSMQYIERISAILMPWTALGWLLGFTVLALRRGGWRYPALFAIAVALAGGTNATSLIYVGIAPIAWVLYVLFVTRESNLTRTLATTSKIGVLSLAVSLWWIAGLRTEAAYGIDVLKYTETVPAIAGPATASEVMRGLGYWYFYGSDRLGPWLSASVEYTQRVALMVVSFILPALGFLGAIVTRWRARAYFILLALVGLVLSVGTHPYNGPSLVGSALKAFMTGTTAGFALRSTDRATPLVILGLAALLGGGLSALATSLRSWRPKLAGSAIVPAALCVALAVVDAAPLMTGLAIDPHFERGENIPSYFYAAAKYLDSKGSSTRVLVEPGNDFADYTWGNTIDPVWPGILTRPSIQRQQLLDGSNATAELLAAFDLTLQQGTYEPSTLAPIARLFSAGDVVLESDYKFWHYNTPAPRPTWALFTSPTPGIGRPIAFGKPVPNEAPGRYSLLDEQALATSPKAPWPPPVAVFPVSNARPIYRAEPASHPLVLDGSGSGIVAAAAAGLLADNPTIIYAGSLDRSTKLLKEAVPPGAVLVLTDTNRKELRRYTSENDNIGETLPATVGPQAPDPTAQPLPIFATSSTASQTVATYSGAHYVSASSYGNPVAFTPEDRPYMAFDDNLDTAWTTAAFSGAGGQWLQVSLDRPATADHIDLVQPYTQQPNRWITKVTITFDGAHSITARLGAASKTSRGQVVSFPTRRFSILRITIDATSWHHSSLTGASGVGFAEVRIPGVHLTETMQLPSDLLSSLGAASLSHRLAIILTRQRVAPTPPRTDPELYMARAFDLPTARTFAVGGTARISALIPDNEIDYILGGRNVFGGAVLGSNERLPGDLNARAVFAFDKSAATFWGPGFGAKAQVGAWMQANLTHTVTFDHLNLQVLADREHSVPSELRITTNGGGDVLVHLPTVAQVDKPGAVANVKVSFAAVHGSVLRFTVEAVRQVKTINWYSEKPIVLPFAIASIGVPGVHFTPENPKAMIPAVCRGNLMTIDNKPVWLKVTGTVRAAENLQGLKVSGCGPDAKGVHLAAGPHRLVTRWGKLTGLDLDRITLDSAAGGTAEPMLASGALRPVPGTLSGQGAAALATPRVRVMSSSATSARLRVTGTSGPFWLVLGESINRGWRAQVVGGPSLGASTLVDGYANGWYIAAPKRSFTVELTWTPQREVDIALVASAVALFACLLLGFLPARVRVWLRARLQRHLRSRHAHERALHRRTPHVEEWGATIGAPWRAEGPPRGVLGALLVGGASAAVGALVLPPHFRVPAALAIGLGALAATRLAGMRLVLTIGALTAAVAAGAATVAGQMVHHYPPGDSWPQSFAHSDTIALIAFVAIGADAIVELVRRAPRSGEGSQQGRDGPRSA